MTIPEKPLNPNKGYNNEACRESQEKTIKGWKKKWGNDAE